MSNPDVTDLSLKIVCFDLDGTLAEPTWPEPTIGEPIPEGVNLLDYYAAEGCAILIHTSRPESHKAAIWKWLELNVPGLVYDVICEKPLAGLYVDDRALQFEREARLVKPDEPVESGETARLADDGADWTVVG